MIHQIAANDIILVAQSRTDNAVRGKQQAGIFDTLGYFEYSDRDALSHRLTSHIDAAPLPFVTNVDTGAPVYVVEPPRKDDAATLMVSRLKFPSASV